MSTRRAFTSEFKIEAVAMVLRQGLSVAEVARRLEIGQNLLRKWREQLAAEGSRAFAAKPQPSALEEENRRLRAENDRLRMEREILKKATVFFAKERACKKSCVSSRKRIVPRHPFLRRLTDGCDIDEEGQRIGEGVCRPGDNAGRAQ